MPIKTIIPINKYNVFGAWLRGLELQFRLRRVRKRSQVKLFLDVPTTHTPLNYSNNKRSSNLGLTP